MGIGKNKIRDRVSFINKKTYNIFKKQHPEISYDEYINVLKSSNKLIKNYILENEMGFKLPYNIGYIAVNKFKQKDKYRIVDWKNTMRLSKFIPITNFHSFGYMFKIDLFKNGMIKPLLLYKLHAHRIIKRDLAKIIKGGKQSYSNLDSSYFNKRFAIERILNKKSK